MSKDLIEQKTHYNGLYVCYQELLTKKQKEVFEKYYFEDYSLSEIAEMQNVSRNAVHLTLKSVIASLDDLESKLHLQALLYKEATIIKKYESSNDEAIKQIIQQLREEE